MENIKELSDLVALANTHEELGNFEKVAEIDEVIKIIAEPSPFAEILGMLERAHALEAEFKEYGQMVFAKAGRGYQAAEAQRDQTQDPARRQQLEAHLHSIKAQMTDFLKYMRFFGGAA